MRNPRLKYSSLLAAILLTSCDNSSTPAVPVAPASTTPVAATYTGSAACAGCHEAEFRAWTGYLTEGSTA